MRLAVKVLDPGHAYELDHLDSDQPWRTCETLCFVKRVGSKFPGNEPPAYAGTTSQEVIRALIDRLKYVDKQIDHTDEVHTQGHQHNRRALDGLRSALRALEERAAMERGDFMSVIAIAQTPMIENTPTCAGCGHCLCSRSHT